MRRRRYYDVAFYVPWVGPLLSPAPGLTTGGAETQVFLVARALAARGVRVCLVAFEVPGVRLPSHLDGVAVSVRPPYRAHEAMGKAREILAAAQAVLTADADVIVTRTAGPHVGIAGFSAKVAGRRFAYSSANVSDFDFGRLAPKRRNEMLYRLGIRLADRLIVQTEEQVRLCRERFGRTATLIPSIAEPAATAERHPEAFLWVGRLVWYKRPLAFVDLARSLPHARFRMVPVTMQYAGESPDLLEEVRRQAATLPNLELLSPRPRPDLMDLIDRAAAVVNTADFEGMPNVFLEAWARGVPALALTHDPDGVIERYGLGAFAARSPERLVDCAAALWDQRDARRDLSARCLRYIAERHSPDSVGEKWQQALGIDGSA